MPHKPAAFELCDAVGPAAQFEGVVNTIRIERGGRLVGEFFDGGGFLNAAREAGVFNPERRCVVIGAGGAGRAICHALAAAGLKQLRILERDAGAGRDAGRKTARSVHRSRHLSDDKFDDAGLVVNATSLGLHATDAMPMDPAKLPNDCAVFDIIAARRTEFMQACAACGLKVIDGVAMIGTNSRYKPPSGAAKLSSHSTGRCSSPDLTKDDYHTHFLR